MIIELIKYDKKRGRIKCKIGKRDYDLPKGLIRRLYDYIYSGEDFDIINQDIMPNEFWEIKN